MKPTVLVSLNSAVVSSTDRRAAADGGDVARRIADVDSPMTIVAYADDPMVVWAVGIVDVV